MDDELIKELGPKPHPRDYKDFIEWWDAVEKWEKALNKLKKKRSRHN